MELCEQEFGGTGSLFACPKVNGRSLTYIQRAEQ